MLYTLHRGLATPCNPWWENPSQRAKSVPPGAACKSHVVRGHGGDGRLFDPLWPEMIPPSTWPEGQPCGDVGATLEHRLAPFRQLSEATTRHSSRRCCAM